MKHRSMKEKKIALGLTASLCAMLLLAGCGAAAASEDAGAAQSAQSVPSVQETQEAQTPEASVQETEPVQETASEAHAPSEDVAEPEAEPESEPEAPAQSEPQETVVTELNSTVTGGVFAAEDLFTERDLTQTPDLTDAIYYSLADNTDIQITEAGVYVLTGSAENVTVYVEAGTEDKVELVLDGASIVNDDFPCIYVKTADKVFVTTTDTENSLSVTGSFIVDGDTNTDGVIFSRQDLVLSGLGTLTISSTDNGIVGKDDLKITGGTYDITAASKSIEANDSIRIAGGALRLTAGTDGLHAENDDDDSVGYIYICGGDITIQAGDDGVHATSVVQIDGGNLDITAAEGIEGTYIQLNGGTITVSASDDGINAANKSSAYPVLIEINDGDITVTMGAGDTDGIDSNGDIVVNGGTITVTGNSTFDYDGTGTYNGGTIIVNGQQVDYIPNQMMGGGMGGFGGRWG